MEGYGGRAQRLLQGSKGRAATAHSKICSGTAGNSEERAWAFNKARFDAERFWYQGNGSIEVTSDAGFDGGAYRERNVVLYGNSVTNRAWRGLLGDSPLQAKDGEVTLGNAVYSGTDFGYVFIRPRAGGRTACVGAIGGSGISGMRLTDRMPYLLPGVAFPDVVIARTSLLSKGEEGGKRPVSSGSTGR